ncbi:hypothetical protein Tco_1277168 [Tanacetum coccineum]
MLSLTIFLLRPSAIRLRDQDDPHDDALLEGENSNQEQLDDFDFWTNSYATDDDKLPTEKVVNENELRPSTSGNQELVEEMLQTVNEAKLRKVVNEMLRQRCTSGEEHQNPKAPALSLVNQDLLYLKKGNSGPEKIVMSLYKFPAVIFSDDDIEERTSRWVDKCLKKFNPYA